MDIKFFLTQTELFFKFDQNMEEQQFYAYRKDFLLSIHHPCLRYYPVYF